MEIFSQRYYEEENSISIEVGLGYLKIPFLLRGHVEKWQQENSDLIFP